MSYLIAFKLIQAAVILTFAVFISDFRKKKDSEAWMNEKALIGIKLFYPIMLGVYTYAVFTLNTISVHDVASLILTSIGSSIVVKAKTDLGKHHTWAGYKLKRTSIVTTGIYSYIRHPLYTGIYVFAFGGIISILVHMPLIISIVVIMGTISLLSFLAFVAVRETDYMEKKLGRRFMKYKKQVHAFLPVRKYKH